MNANNDWWFADLLFVTLLVGLAAVGVLNTGGVVRVALAMPLVLILPGYALTAVLFPATHENSSDVEPFDDGEKGLRSPVPKRYQIDRVERLVLSIVLSIAIVPAVTFVLNFTAYGITLRPILGGIGGVTVFLNAIALFRRWRLPSERRFIGSPRILGRWTSIFWPRRNPLADTRRTDKALNVALAVSLLLVLSSAGYALAAPPEGDQFTEFYLDTENVTGDTESMYQTQFARGESQELPLFIKNQEDQRTKYTLVVVLQQVQRDGEGGTVQSESELARTSTTLENGEKKRLTPSVTPEQTGQNLRLQFLLYKGDAPADASADSAYRTLRHWITVTSGGSANQYTGGVIEAATAGDRGASHG